MRKKQLFSPSMLITAMLSFCPSFVFGQGTSSLTTSLPDGTEIWGNLVSSTDDRPNGMYRFSANSQTLPSSMVENSLYNANGGGVIYQGRYHFVNYDRNYVPTYYEYNISDWTPTGSNNTVLNTTDLIATDLTYDPTTKKVWGCFANVFKKTWTIGTVNWRKQSRTDLFEISSADSSLVAIAANRQGDIYGITQKGMLVKIDKTGGSYTSIGSTGVTPSSYVQSAAFDMHTGRLYWAASYGNNGGGLYSVDLSTGKATLIHTFPQGDEFSSLYVPEPEIAEGAPERVGALSAVFNNGSLTGTVTFTMPTESYQGLTLSGPLSYSIVDSARTIATGTAQPGAVVSKDVTLNAGARSLSVVASNEHGQGQANTIGFYVGYATPQESSSVEATADTTAANVTKILISWRPVRGSLGDGYFNSSDVTYRVVRYPDNKVLADGFKGISFVDSFPSGTVKKYHYGVAAINHGIVGSYSLTDEITVGKGYSLPYSLTVDNEEDFKELQAVDANGDGKTWKFSGHAACYSGNYSKDADDWLLLPEVDLEGNRQIAFDCDAWAYSHYSSERLAVAYGTGDDPSVYKTFVDTTEITNTKDAPQHIKGIFSVPSTGKYRVAVHALSTSSDGWRLSVNNLRLSAGPLLSAPDSVTSLQAKAGSEGALSATVSFKAPARQLGGAVLSSLDTITVIRDDSVPVQSLLRPTPGNSYSVVDDKVAAGLHTYMVKASNNNGYGAESRCSTYVGVDTPVSPSDVKLKDNGDGTASLSWTAPVAGANNGYVYVKNLTYHIWKQQNGDTVEVATVKSNTKCAVKAPIEGTQANLSYGVSASNEAGMSSAAKSNAIVVGSAYMLPFTESFPAGTPSHLWYGDADGYWKFNATTMKSSDNDGGCLNFLSWDKVSRASYTSGKLTLVGTVDPSLAFDIYTKPASAGTDLTLQVVVNDAVNGTTDTLRTIRMSEVKSEGWQRCSVSLKKYIGCSNLIFSFFAKAENDHNTVYIDNISLTDRLGYDLSLKATSASRVRPGRSVPVTLQVTNDGGHTATGYKVALYKGNERLDEAEGLSLAVDSVASYVLHYRPLANEKGKTVITAKVEYPVYDSNPANDSVRLKIDVDASDLPTVNDLAISGNSLSWSAPDLSQTMVTEDFESYVPWSISDVGDWTLFDGDKGTVTGLGNNGRTMPHSGEPMSWIVYNPYDYELDLDKYPSYTPHSGHQYMKALATGNYWDTPLGHNDDWLISPRLSGKAQTVSFYVAKYLDTYGKAEAYEVLYSMSTNDPDSFKLLTADTVKVAAWTEKSYDLPEGAKYFAIRYVSVGDRNFTMMVDEVTYDRYMPALLGYDVWRDGQLLATTKEPGYELDGTDGRYTVSVVYDNNESDFSNEVKLTTGIVSVNGESANDGIQTAYNLTGQMVARGYNIVEKLSRGEYIIKDEVTHRTRHIIINK